MAGLRKYNEDILFAVYVFTRLRLVKIEWPARERSRHITL